MNKIYVVSYGGNKFSAATAINKQGFADYVLDMHFTGSSTIVTYRMPAELVHSLRENDRSFAAEPNFDDMEIDHE